MCQFSILFSEFSERLNYLPSEILYGPKQSFENCYVSGEPQSTPRYLEKTNEDNFSFDSCAAAC